MLFAESDDAQTLSMLFVPLALQLWQSGGRQIGSMCVLVGACRKEGSDESEERVGKVGWLG